MSNKTKKKRNAVEWAMHYRQIIILITACLVAFGIYILPEMRKNEFPDFTIRQGIVVAAAPGNTAQEMMEQVAKPLEKYIFTYKEVRKDKTSTKCRDGIAYIQVQLNDDLNNKDEFWSKFKHGVADFKSQLPANVLAVKVMDDFGDTSALLITMESDDKTYRELDGYMDDLQDVLRQIPSVGRMTVSGLRNEQIAVYVDNDRLSKYGLNEQLLAAALAKKGFATSGGRIKAGTHIQPVYVAKSLNTVYDVQQLIVYADAQGNCVRLKDVAEVKKEYPQPDSYITNNGRKCILLSVEMKKGQNIVKMGDEINAALESFQETLPHDVEIFRITDQSRVVADSVENFLHELLMVTLAALIVTLGMIVDNSIVIIDSYLEMLGEGMSRWHASIKSTTHFFKSIFSATLAISITFFPFLATTTGMLNDFLQSFPWSITIVLAISLLVATLLVPFMQFYFIRKPMNGKDTECGGDKKKKFSFLDSLQRYYDWLLGKCFAHPVATVSVGVVSIVIGAAMISRLPQQLLPYADRNQFAVEITLPVGTRIERTAAVADSLEHILRRNKRVVSVASFKGCSSPRFQNSYAPQIAGTNFAQFIVNTTGNSATAELIDEYAPIYSEYFPEARVRFKQLSYSEAAYPIEIRLSSTNLEHIKHDAAAIIAQLHQMPEMVNVQTDFGDPQAATTVQLHEDEASRLGISNTGVETTLAMRYGNGISLAEVWEGDYSIPVVMKSLKADNATLADISDELIPAAGGLSSVPLRQVADIVPTWNDGQLCRRNGIYTITVQADIERGENAMEVTELVQEKLKGINLSPGVTLSYGGDLEDAAEKMPMVLNGLAIAAVIIFFILVFHFHRVNIAALIFASMALCVFGTAAGICLQGIDFSITCVLGIVSLMGIIVRNGIIMIDYAEELRATEGMNAADAIRHSASRRMRPIFLTSAAASVGVVPMILGGSGLWMPMGTVVFYGTLITMIFILTVLPAAYLLIFRGTATHRAKAAQLEQQ